MPERDGAEGSGSAPRKPPAWRTGRRSRGPKPSPEDEPDWFGDLVREGLLYQHPENSGEGGGKAPPPRWQPRDAVRGWATGAPWRRRKTAEWSDLPAHQAYCVEPP